jgi:Protein of unknown function (DUF3180)
MKLSRTRVRDLVVIAIITALLAFAVLRVVALRGTLPTVPWLAPLTVVAIGVGLMVTAAVLRPRLRRKPGTKPVAPLVAGRLVALAFAGSRAGAVIVGLYSGWLLAGLSVSNALDTEFGRERVITALVTAVAGVVVVAGGLILERVLVISSDDDPRGSQRPPAKPVGPDDRGPV